MAALNETSSSRPSPGPQGQVVVGDRTLVERETDTVGGTLRIGEVLGERATDQFAAGPAGQPAQALVDVGDDQIPSDGDQAVQGRLDQPPVVRLALAERPLRLLALGDVAGGGEHATHGPGGGVGVGGGVERDQQFSPVPGPQGQVVVGDRTLVEREMDTISGTLRIGEVLGERATDQFAAGPAGQSAQALVDVGDDQIPSDGDQAVQGRLDQPPGCTPRSRGAPSPPACAR